MFIIKEDAFEDTIDAAYEDGFDEGYNEGYIDGEDDAVNQLGGDLDDEAFFNTLKDDEVYNA